jgi:lauroyl/myristoyl acyltransferase
MHHLQGGIRRWQAAAASHHACELLGDHDAGAVHLCAGHQAASIYQPLRNPYLNALVLRRREKLGYKLFDRQEGFNGPISHVREMGMLGILVDQHAGYHGLWCPFFDRLASTTNIVALCGHAHQGGDPADDGL